MRTLILFRHAKSAWDDPDTLDFDRPLAERGIAAAPVMAQWLKNTGLGPDFILCSRALRARATLELAQPVLDLRPEQIRCDEGLYLASPDRLLAAIREVADDHAVLMLVGHNPGLHQLALRLTGRGSPSDITRLAQKFPTAAIAVIRFTMPSWTAIGPGMGELRHFETPKRLAVPDRRAV